MASLNRVIVMGNLGQDPELRHTQGGTAVCNLSIATTERRGEEQITEWHSIVVWGKTAEACAKYLSKGRGALVEGRLQTRSWEDRDGQKRYKTEIVAESVQFVGGVKGDGSPSPSRGKAKQDDDDELGDIPF